MSALVFVCVVLISVLVAFCSSQSHFSVRRDQHLPSVLYPERWCDEPKEGGRIHIISTTNLPKDAAMPLSVKLGENISQITIVSSEQSLPGGVDWVNAYFDFPSQQLFVSLHVHTDEILRAIKHVTVLDSLGTILLDDENAVSLPSDLRDIESDLQVTYVTSADSFSSLVVHIHNFGKIPHILNSVFLSGIKVDLQPTLLGSDEHRVVVVAAPPGCKANSLWTAVLSWDNNKHSSAYGGRLPREVFVMEDWPKSEQCPFPVAGANQENYDTLKNELYLNTRFMGGLCDASSADTFYAAAQSNGEFYLLPSEYYTTGAADDLIPKDALSGVIASFTGDEVDSSLDVTFKYWSRALLSHERYPELPIYQGGHSQHLNGAFSGITDIQGMDFYVAACAPHITGTFSKMLIRGAYDYIRLSRDNHRPLTTWAYSQGYCKGCWVLVPNGNELVVQMASVIAGGSKGIMLFQSDIILQHTEAWDMGSKFMASIDAIKNELRLSDVNGAVFKSNVSEGEALVEVLRSPNTLTALTINFNADGYNDLLCYLHGNHSHWAFHNTTIATLSITLPQDIARLISLPTSVTTEPTFFVKEVIDGQMSTILRDGAVSTVVDGIWTVQNVVLTSETVARVFVFELIH